jgi:hypothetical protein
MARELDTVKGDRDRYQKVMAGFYAETIELSHVPPSPYDGPIPSRYIIEVSENEVESLGRALSNLAIGDPEVSVEGEAFRVRGSVSGTLADGTHLAVNTNTVFTVAGGVITGLRSEMSPADAEAWVAVLTSGAAGGR